MRAYPPQQVMRCPEVHRIGRAPDACVPGVQDRTDRHAQRARIVQRHRKLPRREHMLAIIGVVIALIAVVLIVRVPGGVNSARLGWVRQRWLAEYRASHPT